ncbi:MAG: hypothetical protein AB1449_01100 [Chloroflexota bacterium]
MRGQVRAWGPWLGIWLASSAVLAALDPGGWSLRAWLAYAGVCAVGLATIAGAWWLLGPERPKWLLPVLGLAVALRLGAGLALAYLLPSFGYDEPAQQAGYVFYDAYKRDQDAWALARSPQPLTESFGGQIISDQYGGLLFLSALVYRLLSPDLHRPLAMVVLAAATSALAVLWTWAFVSRAFGPRAGSVAAWLAALFPEAILLGASQMREPFLNAGMALAFLGYAGVRQGRWRVGGPAVVGGVVLAGFFSPPFGLMTLIVVVLAWLWEGRSDPRRTGWVLVALGVLGLVAAILTVRAWGAVGEGSGGGLLEVVGRWLTEVPRFQLRTLQDASGWVDDIFRLTPEWLHFPLAILNGLVQPFLPAAIFHPSAPVWWVVMILRALGWFGLLPFLLYAPLAALRASGWRSLEIYLALLAWASAILAAYYAGGDQWDNPRYREVFLVAHAAVAGWAWVWAGRTRAVWLRRCALLVAGATLVFSQWYAGRYYHTPRLSLWGTLALLGAFVVAFFASAWVLDQRRLTASKRGI